MLKVVQSHHCHGIRDVMQKWPVLTVEGGQRHPPKLYVVIYVIDAKKQVYLKEPFLETHLESSEMLVALGAFVSHGFQSEQFTHI